VHNTAIIIVIISIVVVVVIIIIIIIVSDIWVSDFVERLIDLSNSCGALIITTVTCAGLD
jgi:hypothetical protein